MPNVLETGATWLAGQLKAHAGTDCVYRRGDEVFDITLVRERSDVGRDRNWLLDDKELSARSINWVGERVDLVLGDVQITPEPGDEIDWTDDASEPKTAVIFPLVAEHCFRFTDPNHKLLRIYTVDSASFSQVAFRIGDNEFTILGVLGRIAGRQFTTDLQNTVKVSQTIAYFDRGLLEKNNVFAIPNWAKITAHGTEGWVVHMAESEWGAERVKLTLEREELEREYQARRNAAI